MFARGQCCERNYEDLQKRKRYTFGGCCYRRFPFFQSIDIETGKSAITINLTKMLLAFLVIGALVFYTVENRDFFRDTYTERYSVGETVFQENSRAEVFGEFVSGYLQTKSVMFGLANARQHAGEEVTVVFDNGKTMRRTGQFVIAGKEEEEACGIFLRGIAGRGKTCRVSISGSSSVIEDILYVDIGYMDYDVRLLLLVFGSVVLLFLNLTVRLESEERCVRYFQKGYEVIRFFAMPLLMVGALECLGGSITLLGGRELIANMVICMCLYLIVFILTNRLRFSVMLINCLLFIIALVNHFVILFRNAPLLPYDVLSFQTAMTVIGQYEIIINEQVVFSTLIFAAVFSSACRVSFQIEKGRVRAAVAVGSAAFLVGMTVVFYGVLYPYWGLSYSTWMPIETYQKNGYLMATMIFTKYATLHRPKGYSAKKAQKILDSFAEAEIKNIECRPDNLIVVMNESWSTLDYIQSVRTNVPYNAFYQNLSGNTIKGNVYVSICGGNTAQTEYEFFTGNSVSMLPSGATAYEFFVKKNTENICDTLIAEDYRCFAIHPFFASSYQRDRAYDIFGFEDFITQEAFEGKEKIRSYYSDKATFDKVIELYENKQAGERLFIWDLTMQNHGGYEEDGFEQEVFLTEYPQLGQASTYLTMMKHTDEALEELIAYFEKEDEPTMIVMFGDHQPALGDETYNILYGENENEVGEEDREKRYITPLLIWSNYEIEEGNVEQISSNYLSSYMFYQAGLPLTSYQKLLLDLYQYYPVINAQGVYDAQGTYWSWDDVQNSSEYEKLHNYQIVQYYMMKK